MPSTPSPFRGPDALVALATAAHDQLADDPRGALLRVHETAPVAECLGWKSLEGVHPVDALLGFVAPDDWRAIGVCTTGRAHSPRGTEAVTLTLLVDRAGGTASVLQRGGALEVLPGRPDGMVADACRRALGLPTAPPPGSSLVLWTLTWLDRVVAKAHDRLPGQPGPSWAAMARLHPASSGPGDPVALALDAAALAEAWPWGRLRAEPALADLPGSPPSASLAQWMDDGMWARWLIRELPPAAELLEATRALLPAVMADAVDLVVAAAVDGGGWAVDEPGGWGGVLDEDWP
jgi:hypothetical protein